MTNRSLSTQIVRPGLKRQTGPLFFNSYTFQYLPNIFPNVWKPCCISFDALRFHRRKTGTYKQIREGREWLAAGCCSGLYSLSGIDFGAFSGTWSTNPSRCLSAHSIRSTSAARNAADKTNRSLCFIIEIFARINEDHPCGQ